MRKSFYRIAAACTGEAATPRRDHRHDATPPRARPGRYDGVAQSLHWLIALAVLAQIALGLWMIDIPKLPVGVRAYWFNLHKSIGLTIGLLVLLRLAWRLTHRPPALTHLPVWQARAAGTSHLLLYACMLAMPLAGYLGSTFSGYPIRFFGMVLPGWGWKDDGLKAFFSAVHYITAFVFIALIAVHVTAALKHLAVDRDGVFQRMLPARAIRARSRP